MLGNPGWGKHSLLNTKPRSMVLQEKLSAFSLPSELEQILFCGKLVRDIHGDKNDVTVSLYVPRDEAGTEAGCRQFLLLQ